MNTQKKCTHYIHLLTLRRLFENLAIIDSTDWKDKGCQYENKTFFNKANGYFPPSLTF